jgi:nitrate/nitrite transporter NarK
MTATMAASSPLGGWLAERVGTRIVVTTGGLIGAAGVMALLSLDSSARALDVALRLALVGLALGLSTGPSQAAALTTVPSVQSGRAAAVISMMRYVGSITGTLVLGFALHAGADSPARHQLALWIFVGAFAGSALLAMALPRAQPAAEPGRLKTFVGSQ